jgi:vitamin B12 transporter
MKLGVLAILMFASLFGLAQEVDPVSDSSNLKESVIYGHSIWRRSSSTVMDSSMISSFQGSSMADLLAMIQPVHVKSYGNSGLATIAYRGLDASSLNLIWNGVKLNSSFNGMVDFATIPSFFFEEAQVYSNTSSSFSQGGALGADLLLKSSHLSSDSAKGVKATGMVNYGSFRNFGFGVKLKIISKKSSSLTKIFLSQAENNFEYKPVDFNSNQQYGKLEHAAYTSRGIIHENKLLINKSRLHISFWLQDNQRQIPATLLEASSEKSQTDSKATIAINGFRDIGRAKISTYNSLIKHVQVYDDLIADINGKLLVVTIQNTLEYKTKLKDRMLLSAQISSSYAEARTSNYNGTKSQHFGSQNTSLKYFNKRLKWELGLRSLLAGEGSAFIMPHASVRHLFGDWLRVHISTENNGRLPTLNELYWIPGGDIHAVPMNSWKHEIGTRFHSKHFNFDQIIYLTDVESYIEWLPNQNGTFVVTQQQFIRASGSESHLSTKHRVKNLQVLQHLSYNYTRSVKGRDLSETTPQRIFIPEHTSSYTAQVQIKDARISYVHSYTSSRNISSHGQMTIAAYDLGNVSLSYRFTNLVMRARIRNVWDKEYYVLPFRPMPSRHYELSLSYQIKKQQHLNKNI